MKKMKHLGLILLILSVVVIFSVNHIFYEPTEINFFIASKIYKTPANGYFKDDNLYKLIVDAYNEENDASLAYTYNLTDQQLKTIRYLTLECEQVWDENGTYCSNHITDLSGLERLTSLYSLSIYNFPFGNIDVSSFTALASLTINYTEIDSIDVSKNLELSYLDLSANKINSLDVSKNADLLELNVKYNELTNIDVSNNVNLFSLDVSENEISSLDVTKNPELFSLDAAGTLITSLNLTNNSKLLNLSLGTEIMWGVGCGEENCYWPSYESYITNLDLSNNTLLEYLYIDNAPIESLDLSHNINLVSLSATATSLKTLDLSNNNNLLYLTVGSYNLNSLKLGNAPLMTLSIKAPNLTALHLNEYQNNLMDLDLEGTSIRNINLENLKNLEFLSLNGTNLTSLDISKNVELRQFSFGKEYYAVDGEPLVSDFNVTNIDMSKNTNLTYLYISDAPIESLDLSHNINLEQVSVKSSNMSSLKLGNAHLTRLSIDAPNLTALNLNQYQNDLVDLSLKNIPIEEIDLENLTKLEMLSLAGTGLTSLDVSKNVDLYMLELIDSHIKNLDLSKNMNLGFLDLDSDFGEELYVYNGKNVKVNNTVKLPSNYEADDIVWKSEDENIAHVSADGVVSTLKSGIVKIKGVVGEYYIDEYYNLYTTTSAVNVVQITSDKYVIDEENNVITVSDNSLEEIKNNISISNEDVTLDVDLENNKLYVKYNEDILKEFELEYKSENINVFTDENFYKCVVDSYNTTNNTSYPYTYNLSDDELKSIFSLSCSSKDIVSAQGLEKLTSLIYLNLNYNELTSLDVSKNINLESIHIDTNKIVSLDLSNNSKLTGLHAYYNQLKFLDVSNNPKLTTLYLRDNNLETLDISNNVNLVTLIVDENQLTSLDVSNNLKLKVLDVNDNKLKLLNVSKNVNLEYLYVYRNNLTSLNVDNNSKLKTLSVADNRLSTLNLNNNINLTILNIGGSDIGYDDKARHGNIGGVHGNLLNELDVSNNKLLTEIYASYNKLTELNVENNTALYLLSVSNNQLTALNVSKNTVLDDLNVSSNYLKEIDVSKNPSLIDLYVYNNQLVTLDVSNNLSLKNMNVSNNKLTAIDVSKNTALVYLNIDDNPFGETLYVYKNGSVTVGDNIKISSHLTNFKNPTFVSSNEEIAVVVEKGIVKTLKNGFALINGETGMCYGELCYNHYTTTSIINVVEITSDKYIINDEDGYIYIGIDNNIDTIKRNIMIPYEEVIVDIDLSNNKLQVKHGEDILKEFKILSVDLGELKGSNKMISISDNISYDDFIDNITLSNGLSYKILSGNNEVTSSNVTVGMLLKVYYGGREIDSFDITDEYIDISDDLEVNEEFGYLSNIDLNVSASNFLGKINTSGDITITNSKNEVITGNNLIGTGSKVSIKLNSRTATYLVVIRGDITGDGELKLADIMKIANYTYKDKNSLTGVYASAADYDNNGKYNLQDIMKPANELYGGGN